MCHCDHRHVVRQAGMRRTCVIVQTVAEGALPFVPESLGTIAELRAPLLAARRLLFCDTRCGSGPPSAAELLMVRC
jgi:hypothetical protein